MNETEKIRYLETLAANGYVPLETLEYDGWQLGFSNGYTGRANSVLIKGDSTITLEEKVRYCEKEYASRDLPCMFKLTDADNDINDYLLKHGYKIAKTTDLMILDMSELNTEDDLSDIYSDVVFETTPDDWFKYYFEYEKISETERDICAKIHSKVKAQKIYIKVLKEGKVVAVASVVIEDGYSLLHNVIVDPAFRKMGLGKKLCQAAIAKSKEAGAEYSYLQVMQSNDIAVNLYKSIGFKKLYSYWYISNRIENKEIK